MHCEARNICEFKKLSDTVVFFLNFILRVQKMWRFFPSDSCLHKDPALGPAHSRSAAGFGEPSWLYCGI